MALMIPRRGLLLGGAALAIPTVRSAQAQAQTYEFVAGSVGGGWYTIAAGFSSLIAEENPEIRLRVVPGGGLANSTRVNNNQSQMGFGIDAFTAAAARGEEPYTAKHENLLSLGVGYSPTEHNFIRKADGPEGMREILLTRGVRIGCPQRSSTDEMTLQRIMKFYGTSPDAIRSGGGRYLNGSYADIAAAYADGQVDYLYCALAKPAAIITEIGQGRRPSRMIAWPDDLRKHLIDTYAYNEGTLPANTYPTLEQTADMRVTTMDTVIMTHRTVPEPAAYGITRTLIRNKGARLTQIHASCAAFDPAQAWKYNGVPLHPGAARAFREAGVMPA